MAGLKYKTGGSALYERIFSLVSQIPSGRVMTYGQIARLLGVNNPRQVGYALHTLPDGDDVPWHRVLNHAGKISLPDHNGNATLQRKLLESEAVLFNGAGAVDLDVYAWRP
jgi:methylated-DNA-protein-cysteine methyltransferase-like protein